MTKGKIHSFSLELLKTLGRRFNISYTKSTINTTNTIKNNQGSVTITNYAQKGKGGDYDK